jgi:hypothetical protein
VGFREPNNAFVMAGTFGALVVDSWSSGRVPPSIYVLSNNHVLAGENQLPVGSRIFQPGLLDGGNPASDRIANLSTFIPLNAAQANSVDCAVAFVASTVQPRRRVSPSILKIGTPKGSANAAIDMVVEKFGRTTRYTVGRITSIDTDALVDYDMGQLKFTSQIVIESINNNPFSDSGDSGSLIVERQSGNAVGLLFGGSAIVTLANHIDDVLQALEVDLVLC